MEQVVELCAVVSIDQRHGGVAYSLGTLFNPTVPTPLHFAVLARVSLNHGRTAQLTSELAQQFAELGWCTQEEYTRITRDLIDSGLAEGIQLRVNPLLHTGDDCRRCAEHVQIYEQDLRDYEKAISRWNASVASYPYDTSTTTLHLRDCTHAPGKPTTPDRTLREYVHNHDLVTSRLVTAEDDAEVTMDDLGPGGMWWDRSYGPPPGDGRRGGHHRHHCLSIREARAWTSGNGRRRTWKPCKVCRPIDPYLLDTADTTVLYRAETSPATVITVEADDGQSITTIRRLTPSPGTTFGWGQAPAAERVNTAIEILTNATSSTAAESIHLPYNEFADTFPPMRSDMALTISRTEVRAWLRDWYNEHPSKPAPAALAVLLTHDLALRPDPNRLTTLR